MPDGQYSPAQAISEVQRALANYVIGFCKTDEEIELCTKIEENYLPELQSKIEARIEQETTKTSRNSQN